MCFSWYLDLRLAMKIGCPLPDNLFSYPANRFSFFPCFPLPRLCEADGSFHSLAFPRRSLHL